MESIPTRKIGDRVRLMQTSGVQLQYQNAHGYVTDVRPGHQGDQICAVKINDPKRPSIDGLTVYVSSASLMAAGKGEE